MKLISKNINKLHDERISTGERMADGLAKFAGSWTFIGSFAVFLIVWMIINTTLVIVSHFDPYPFILLNLCLSCLAAIQAPVILMSQNREEVRDRLRAENDYEVNVKSEKEIESLHQKLDEVLNILSSQKEKV
jgi:uncharacterized membrane protein